ncbi:MAG: c-type cytochrome [Gammaproteobacteria bacterium]|jgi:cytochrome c oxidase subunit 2
MAMAVVLILLVVGSLLFHFLSPWWFTPIASNWGAIDTTIDITFVITGIVFVLINGFLAYCVVKFRHKEGGRAHYEPENKKLEIGLTVFTSIGVIAMLAPGLFVWAEFVNVPEDAAEVEVVGQQWRWSYRYPGDDGIFGTTDISHMSIENPFGINPEDPNGQDDVLVRDSSLRLLKDRPVKLWLRSLDVLHNFTVPQFRVKMDLVPGMVTHLWLTPIITGEFEIMCEELCGLAHYSMRGRVIVEDEPAYSNWLASQKTFRQTVAESNTNLARGQALFAVCASCHGQQGEGNVTLNAPKIAGMSAWYIEDQINKYKNGMRGTHENDLYGKQMAPMAATLTSEDAIKDVAAYIASLSGNSSNATISGDIENGRRLYTTCGACHGKEGEGVWSVSAPRLAGQDDWYLVRQLNNFKLGMRGTHVSDAAGMQMALLSGMLKQEGSIEDVVTYINSLK